MEILKCVQDNQPPNEKNQPNENVLPLTENSNNVSSQIANIASLPIPITVSSPIANIASLPIPITVSSPVSNTVSLPIQNTVLSSIENTVSPPITVSSLIPNVVQPVSTVTSTVMSSNADLSSGASNATLKDPSSRTKARMIIVPYTLTRQSLYRNWKVRVLNELEYYGLSYATTLSVSKNNKEADDMEAAKLTIIQRIDDEHLRQVEDCKTAHEMLQVLEDFREPRSSIGDITLLRKLYNLIYDGSTSVHEFIREYETTQKDLERYSGMPVDERTLKRHLIMAVEGAYPNIKATERYTKGAVSYKELKNQLIDEVESNVDGEKRNQNALVSFKKNTSKMTCFKCGGEGHGESQCKRTDGKRKCFNCLEFVSDHIGKTCPKKQPTKKIFGHQDRKNKMLKVKRNKQVKRLRNNQKVSANLAIRDVDHEDVDSETMIVSENDLQAGDQIIEIYHPEEDAALSCIESNEQGKIFVEFIVDSGATAHFIRVEDRLTRVRKLVEPKVIAGINKNKKANVIIDKEGDLLFYDKNGNESQIKNVLISDKINFNLFSLKQFVNKNTYAKIFHDHIEICDVRNDEIILQGPFERNFWRVYLPIKDNKNQFAALVDENESIGPNNKRKINTEDSENNNNKRIKTIDEKNNEKDALSHDKNMEKDALSQQKISLEDNNMNIEDLCELKDSRVDKVIDEIGLLWHKRLNHCSQSYLIALSKMIPELKNVKFPNSIQNCDACIRGKLKKNPSKEIRKRANRILERVHTDTMGPITPVSYRSKYRYIVVFVDDYSKYAMCFALKDKTEIHESLKEYIKEMRSNLDNEKIKINIIRTDNGTEFQTDEMKDLKSKEGFDYQFAEPGTPEHNSTSERFNRTIQERIRCLLFDAGLPLQFWNFALGFATHVYNRTPNKSINFKTPYEMIFGRVPTLKHIYRFGCAAYVKDLNPKRKFGDRAIRGILVGCTETGLRVLIPETGKIIDSKHVKCVESVTYGNLYSQNKNKNETIVNDPELNDEERICEFFKEVKTVSENNNPSNIINVPDSNANEQNDLFKDNDFENESNKKHDTEDFEIESVECEEIEEFDEANLFECFVSAVGSENEPVTISDALNSEAGQSWKAGILEELNSMIKMNTWIKIKRDDVPKGVRIIDSKWVLKIKDEPNGQKRFRARLTGRGFKDKNEYDRTEKFAPVSKIGDMRALFSMVAKYKLRIDQLDVKVAFLNGELEKPVYMELPDGYDLIDNNYDENTVLELKKALYGLKVSSKRWFIRFRDFIVSKGFHEYEFQPCIFSWRRKKNFVIISLYVDDMIIIGNQHDKIDETKRLLKNEFDMKDLGKPKSFLGIDITVTNDFEVHLNVKTAINKMLKKFNFDECKAVKTPMITRQAERRETELKKDNGFDREKIPYRNAVGSLLYLANACRPDIAYATYTLSRKCNVFEEQDWIAVKRVFRYLQGTKDWGLKYLGIDSGLRCYVDASFGCNENGSSVTGFVIELNGDIISWKTVKQRNVSLSSAECEYIAMSRAAREVVSVNEMKKRLFKDYSIPEMFEDNTSAIKHAKSDDVPTLRHLVRINLHYIRSLVQKKMINVNWISTKDQKGDFFTKPLGTTKFVEFREKMMSKINNENVLY